MLIKEKIARDNKCELCGKQLSITSYYRGITLCISCSKKEHFKTHKPNNYKNGCTTKNYYCKQCGQSICTVSALYGSGLCRSCSHKGKLNSKLSKRMKGKNNPNYKHGKKQNDNLCIDCGTKISPGAIRCLKCGHIYQGKQIVGKKNGNFGQCRTPFFTKYREILMRSSWEVKFAKFLDFHNIKWQYEPKTFDLGDTTYTPDFYLPETDEYIEIKGYLSSLNKFKMQLTSIFYPFQKLILLQKEELISLGVL